MVYISDILARQILDSRGNPTLEVDVKLSELKKLLTKLIEIDKLIKL